MAQAGLRLCSCSWAGVIWRGDSLIDGVPETLGMLRAMVRPATEPFAATLAAAPAQAAGPWPGSDTAGARCNNVSLNASPSWEAPGWCSPHAARRACQCRRPIKLQGGHTSNSPPHLQGKKLVFVTNNSTKSRAGYLGKFTKLGLKVSAEEIYSSSYAAAAYLESIDFPKNKKARL